MKDREAWHAAVHGVTKSGTRLRDRTELINHENYRITFGCMERKKLILKTISYLLSSFVKKGYYYGLKKHKKCIAIDLFPIVFDML